MKNNLGMIITAQIGRTHNKLTPILETATTGEKASPGAHILSMLHLR